jgi:polyphosphate glucokinase
MANVDVPEAEADMTSGRISIGVDVGGSGIKAAVVDTESGRFRSERLRVATPNPSVPDAVVASIARLVKRLARSSGLGPTTPVGVGLPGVTIDGTLKFAGNIDQAWIGYPVVDRLTRATGRPITIVNDADAAGIAEMRFGVGRDKQGVVIFLTLGTGVGSGVFNDGRLVPNTEFGQMEIRGRAAERRSAAAARLKRGLSWKAWSADLDEHIDRIDKLMWPNLFIIGGGVSKNADKFLPRLTTRVPVVPASLRNDAGIIGAAIVAAENAARPPAKTTVALPGGAPVATPSADPTAGQTAVATARSTSKKPGRSSPETGA